MSLINFLLLLTVFLTPLFGAVNAFGYEQIKILFFILSISLMGFIWLFQKPKLEWNLIRLASFLFILTLFISFSLGIDFKNSLLGTDPYFQGLLIYAYLFLFSLIVSSTKFSLTSLSVVLIASGMIVSLVAIQGWILNNLFNLDIPNYAGRVVSTFGQPNFYSGFLLLSLPFAYYLLKKGYRWMVLILIILMIGILVSYSRIAIFLSLILCILALLDQFKIRFRNFLVVSVVILTVFFGVADKEFIKPLNTTDPDLTKESVENRVYIWPQAIKVGLERPFFGYGLENINVAFRNYFEKYKHPLFEENLNISPVLISLKDLNLDRTHNYILDLFLFSGIFGVMSWLLLTWLLIKKCKNKYLLTGLLTYLIWIQFQNQSIVHLIYFWLIVGIIDKEFNTS